MSLIERLLVGDDAGSAGTSEPGSRTLGLRDLLLGCAICGLIGAMAMTALNGVGLFSNSKYHTDLTQSPHWFAYHGDAFPEGDLLVEYATYNESPVQNAIYWVGSLFVDVVLLNKLVGIAIFGVTAGLFFGLVASMSNPRTGVLASMFYVVFPRATYETAGGFSKAWAIGFVLLAVYVVETRHWRILPWAMPFAALAYPVSAVLIGAIVTVGLALELPRSFAEAIRGLKYLAGASALAVIPLFYKYLTPPDFIGEMISSERMREMWKSGESSSYTLPMWEELLSYLEHPFFIYGVVLLLILLARRGLVWKRSWTALVVASAISYHVADFVVPRLYVPDRYCRFSIAVLLVLWFAYNGDRVLGLIRRPRVRGAALVALGLVAAISFPESFRPCRGRQDQGLWEDKGRLAGVSRAVAAQPGPVMVAGHPYLTAEVMVQAARPVLVINRLYHAWFKQYRKAIDRRHRAIFRALFAGDAAEVNELHHSFGVTHLVVDARNYKGHAFTSGRLFRKEYNEFIAELTSSTDDFVLNPPPLDSVVYVDDDFWLVKLPLETD